MSTPVVSQEPCPFCGGWRWYCWFVDERIARSMLTILNAALVDLHYTVLSDLSESADECYGCGAVVSCPVEVL